jgi:hypothetical protein
MKHELTPHEDAEVIETPTSRVWIGADNISRVVILPSAKNEVKDLQGLIEAIRKLCKGELRPGLVDIRDLKIFSRDIRQYYGDKERPRAANATAFLVESSLSKLFGNVLISLGKPLYPVKLFTLEDEAVDWLKEFL